MNNQERQKVILLIEDEVDLVDVYSEYLNSAGYKVMTAYNGEEGLRMARDKVWDLMLLDIMLPEKDGMAVLEAIAMEPNIKRGPLLVLTNLNSEDLIERAYALNIDDYLIKSEVNLDALVKKVKDYLN